MYIHSIRKPTRSQSNSLANKMKMAMSMLLIEMNCYAPIKLLTLLKNIAQASHIYMFFHFPNFNNFRTFRDNSK